MFWKLHIARNILLKKKFNLFFFWVGWKKLNNFVHGVKYKRKLSWVIYALKAFYFEGLHEKSFPIFVRHRRWGNGSHSFLHLFTKKWGCEIFRGKNKNQSRNWNWKSFSMKPKSHLVFPLFFIPTRFLCVSQNIRKSSKVNKKNLKIYQ